MSFKTGSVSALKGLKVVKHGLPLVAAALFLTLLWQRLAEINGAQVWFALSTVSVWNWGLAVLATALSFWAVGRYDAIIHRQLNTAIQAKAAIRSGMASIAVAQTLGFGVVTGAIARWRMLPDLSIWTATKVSAMVALTFFIGLGVVMGIVTLLLPLPQFSDGPWASFQVGIVLAGFAVFLTALWAPDLSLFGKRLHLPPLRVLLSITALTALDTFAAAAALWVLLPTGVELPFHILLPVFLLSLSAGLLSGTPGGVGPFELTFLALMPALDAASLIAAICAFRLVYYALPALLGIMAVAFWPHERARERQAMLLPHRHDLDQLLKHAPSEHGILRQGEARVLSGPFPAIQCVQKTGQALISLGAPIHGTQKQALDALTRAARARNLVPCFYKCSARMAETARQNGWLALSIAEDALVTPQNFDLETPDCRSLRRKLRKAQKAGLSVKASPSKLPMAQMAEVAASWADRQGGERGFSMGRFHPAYIRQQRVFLARKDEKLVGFISLHVSEEDWTLDLIRFSDEAPDGTIYALVAAALKAAKHEEVPVVSLAAAPLVPTGQGLEKWCRVQYERRSGGAGLRQFKNAFRPNWRKRYICAPGFWSMTLAAFDIARAVHFPKGASSDTDTNVAHDNYDEYELASSPQP